MASSSDSLRPGRCTIPTKRRAGFVVCHVGATLASPAQAGFIGTKFDPPFFDGTGTFFLPDVPGCLGLSDGFHTVNGGSDPCTGVVLVNAAVSVSDGGGTAHLSLPPPTPGATDVTGIVIDTTAPQLVVGVNTIMIPINVDSCTGDLCDFGWFIEWNSGLPAGDLLANPIEHSPLHPGNRRSRPSQCGRVHDGALAEVCVEFQGADS